MKQLVALLCALACLTAGVRAQNIVVGSAVGQSPSAFVGSHLLGGGVYVFNVKFNNASGNISQPQIGTFGANGYTALAMQQGVLMTTGGIDVAPGPNDEGNASSPMNPYYADPAMQAFASGTVMGCATLDFDFVGLTNDVSFNYIFASEEYPEYVCSPYADVFALLLTGPDPATGEVVTRNLALIPGTVTDSTPGGVAVAIGTVNPGTPGIYGGSGSGCRYDFSYFYNDNTDVMLNQGIEYDGFTDKLQASAQIVPCEVYHMHISVCNVGDNMKGSALFLEGNSFTIPGVSIGLSRPGVDTVLGYCPYTVPLTLAGTPFDYGHVNFVTGGDAVAGTDYLLTDGEGHDVIASGIDIGNDTRSIVLQVRPGVDLTYHKTVELCLETQLCPAVPGLVVRDTMRFALFRGDGVRLRDTTITCSYVCLQVEAELMYGEPPIAYQWQPTTGIDYPNRRVSSAFITESSDYRLIATGGSNCSSDTAQVRIVITGEDPGGVVGPGAGQDGWRVWPNPAAGVLHLEAAEPDGAGWQEVELYAADGRRVLRQPVACGQVDIPVDGLAGGVYTVRVRTVAGFLTAKVVINEL